MSDEAVHVKPAGEVLRRVEVIPAPRQARCLCEDLNPSERPCVVCEVRAPAPTTPTEVKPGTCAEQEAMVRAHGAGQDSALRTVAGYLNLNEDATLAQIEQRISTLRELERAVIRGTSPAPSRPAAEVLEAEPAHVRGLTYHHEVSARTIYLEWEPGNGSCYRLLITLLSNLPALALRRMGFTREAALVTWENPPTHGPLTVKLRRAVAWRYIWDKWEGQSRVDVLEVARAIEAALGWDLLTREGGTIDSSHAAVTAREAVAFGDALLAVLAAPRTIETETGYMCKIAFEAETIPAEEPTAAPTREPSADP